MEIDVHAAQPFDQLSEAFGSVVAGDVDGLGLDLPGGFGAERFEGFLTASRRPDPPSCADAEPGDFEPDARRGACDDDPFHNGYCTHSMPTRRSRFRPSSER